MTFTDQILEFLELRATRVATAGSDWFRFLHPEEPEEFDHEKYFDELEEE